MLLIEVQIVRRYEDLLAALLGYVSPAVHQAFSSLEPSPAELISVGLGYEQSHWYLWRQHRSPGSQQSREALLPIGELLDALTSGQRCERESEEAAKSPLAEENDLIQVAALGIIDWEAVEEETGYDSSDDVGEMEPFMLLSATAMVTVALERAVLPTLPVKLAKDCAWYVFDDIECPDVQAPCPLYRGEVFPLDDFRETLPNLTKTAWAQAYLESLCDEIARCRAALRARKKASPQPLIDLARRHYSPALLDL